MPVIKEETPVVTKHKPKLRGLTYPGPVPVRVIMITMAQIPKLPVTEEGYGVEWRSVFNRICNTYKTPANGIIDLQFVLNCELDIPLFGIKHYVHYFSTAATPADAPTYLMFHAWNEVTLGEVVEGIDSFIADTQFVNRSNPQTYEEAICAAISKLASEIGGTASPIVKTNKPFKGTWYCAGGTKYKFKEFFEQKKRSNRLKVVSSNK